MIKNSILSIYRNIRGKVKIQKYELDNTKFGPMVSKFNV